MITKRKRLFYGTEITYEKKTHLFCSLKYITNNKKKHFINNNNVKSNIIITYFIFVFVFNNETL